MARVRLDHDRAAGGPRPGGVGARMLELLGAEGSSKNLPGRD